MSEKEYELVILPDGTIKFLYYDELKPLLSAGEDANVKRVSHVDPEMTPDGLKWFGPSSREGAETGAVRH